MSPAQLAAMQANMANANPVGGQLPQGTAATPGTGQALPDPAGINPQLQAQQQALVAQQQQIALLKWLLSRLPVLVLLILRQPLCLGLCRRKAFEISGSSVLSSSKAAEQRTNTLGAVFKLGSRVSRITSPFDLLPPYRFLFIRGTDGIEFRNRR